MQQSNSTTVTREHLYQQVWETPMQTLAASYGISGNGLAKICDKMKVPYPSRGYWAKVQAGKPVGRRAPLPATGNDTPDKWTIQATLKPTPPDLPVDVAEGVAKAQATGAEAVQRLSTPFRLRHSLVIQWKRETADGDPAHPRPSRMHGEVENPHVLNRRLRILDALFVALEHAGAQIDEKKSSLSGFVVRFGPSEVEARLVERLKQIREPIDTKYKDWSIYRDRPWNQKLVGTGTLVLRIESYTDHPCRKEWKDNDATPLEEQLGLIAPAFVVTAHYVGLREKRFADERKRWAAEQHRREEIARQKQLEQQKFDDLVALTMQWQKAEAIRAFADTVERRATDQETSAEVGRWAAWARRKADELDGVDILLERHRNR